VAWLVPELDDGVEPELKPEFELEFELDEPELDVPEPDVPELDVPEPGVPEPDVPELDVPELDVPELDVPEPEVLLEEVPELPEVPAESDEEVLCVDPGRVSATTPTAATLARVTVVVAERTLDRPRSRSAIARRTRSRYSSLINSILRSRNPDPLQETSRLAMRPASVLPPRRRG
jgi:hypothetical protein